MDRRPRIDCLQTRPRPDFAAALDGALGLAGTAVAEGARVLALPEHCGWTTLEGGVSVAAPGAVGVGPVDGGGERHCRALVVGRWGDPISEGGDRTGVRHATLDLDDMAVARARTLSLAGDRPYVLIETPDRLAS